VGEVAKRTLYSWSYGKTGSGVICPHLCTTLERAQARAEERYVRVDRERHPDAVAQKLEWREQTSPRGFGFGNRFWTLYAERRPTTRRYSAFNDFTGHMFRTDYMVNEMWMEDEDE
jgi:hypothetical protein